MPFAGILLSRAATPSFTFFVFMNLEPFVTVNDLPVRAPILLEDNINPIVLGACDYKGYCYWGKPVQGLWQWRYHQNAPSGFIYWLPASSIFLPARASGKKGIIGNKIGRCPKPVEIIKGNRKPSALGACDKKGYCWWGKLVGEAWQWHYHDERTPDDTHWLSAHVIILPARVPAKKLIIDKHAWRNY
jgi:hypothetical protein